MKAFETERLVVRRLRPADLDDFAALCGDPEVVRYAGRLAQDIPTNHSPNFTPIIHPTLETGVEAMVVAA